MQEPEVVAAGKDGVFRKRLMAALPERVAPTWTVRKLRWCAVCQCACADVGDKCPACYGRLSADTLNGYGCRACGRVYLSIKGAEGCEHS